MVNMSPAGGTSLAPTPTHPHQMSREPSKEDIEMAENLSLLNSSQEPKRQRPGSAAPGQQSVASPREENSEIYHSLEDTLHFQRNEPDHAPSPAPTTSLAQGSVEHGNAPITGQVCRCVTNLLYCLYSPPRLRASLSAQFFGNSMLMGTQ